MMARMFKVGDIIQIINEKSSFHRCLFVVHEVVESGCWAYMTGQDEVSWMKFNADDFSVVGTTISELVIRPSEQETPEK
jgi:hypothetical protein